MQTKPLRGLQALEVWAKRITTGYKDVNVRDLSASWRDGLAFCALVHHFHPDLIDFDSLSKENIFANNELAFSAAEGVGVPALLSAEDMVNMQVPDSKSIALYLSELYKHFEGPRLRQKQQQQQPQQSPQPQFPQKKTISF